MLNPARPLDPGLVGFLVRDWLRAYTLTALPAYAAHSAEGFDAMLELAARLAADWFAPHYRVSDREEPRLEAGSVRVLPEIRSALEVYRDAGLFGAGFPADLGGLQVPRLIETAMMAQFMAANIATSAYPMLTAANARLIVRAGTPAQVERFARPQIEGRALGTMCLSEPHAGSSLADIRTRAEFVGEDPLGPRYRLRGTKMWISAGDHDITPDITHLVLAKAASVGAPLERVPLSLFIVPKRLEGGRPNAVVCIGLNHKMGYRGTSNCVLTFGAEEPQDGEAPGAVGYRLGAEGEGLALMFSMMNEARIAVGLGAAALACRGYALSLAYARERRQGRPPQLRGRKTGEPVAIIDHADVKRMLLDQKVFAEGALALVLFCARLVDDATSAVSQERRQRSESLLALLTPIAKSWPSQFGLQANDLAIQVHGGYGYTRDFDVEQLYRDNRLNAIHEGTQGVQALDLLGRKILRDGGVALEILGAEICAALARADSSPSLATLCAPIAEAWQDVEETVTVLARVEDPVRATADADAFLSAFGHVVVAWLWLDQALAAEQLRDPSEAARGRLPCCRYFVATKLPQARERLALVRAAKPAMLDFPVELM